MSLLRQALPERGVVGYVTDAQGDELGLRYFSTQYVLAPLVVQIDMKQGLVIGDFRVPSAAERHLEDLVVLRDFGNGLLLLERKPQ